MFNLPLYDKNMFKSFTKDKILHILIIAIVIGIFAFYKSMQDEQARQQQIDSFQKMNQLNTQINSLKDPANTAH